MAAIVAIIGVVVFVAHFLVLMFQKTRIPDVLLLMLGGTSSAVVIPLIDGLGLSERPRTVLFLESALTDVLCIVGAVGLLEAVESQQVDVVRGRVAASSKHGLTR